MQGCTGRSIFCQSRSRNWVSHHMSRISIGGCSKNTRQLFLWPLDVAASVLWGARLTAILLFAGFILYEVTEDQEINDQAYRDIQGFVIGLGVGAVVQVLLAAFVIA